MKKAKRTKFEQFDPELDGQGRVQAPVKKKHLPPASKGSALGDALRLALAKRQPN